MKSAGGGAITEDRGGGGAMVEGRKVKRGGVARLEE